MKHYKDINGKFYGYSEGQVVPEGMVEVTLEEVKSGVTAKLQAEFEALPYNDKRITEYPSIGDQLDALFHAGVFPAEMAAQIQAVKDKYPKGGSV
jgi:hypothetical protein